MPEKSIQIFCDDHSLLSAAENCASALSLDVVTEPSLEVSYTLSFSNGFVELISNIKKQKILVDFVGGKTGHRRKFGGGKGQMIAKAVGLHQKKGLRVLDATAGLGGDAFVLASLGAELTLFERSPIAFALLENGLMRAREYAYEEDEDLLEILSRMELRSQDSIAFLNGNSECKFDVVYLDPMFPERNKSAAVKKEMAVFHDVVGVDEDDAGLLDGALEHAIYRVVVKRPRIAPTLTSTKPNYELSGKSSRYDIYTLKGLTQ